MKTVFLSCLASALTIILPVMPFIYLVGLFIILDTLTALLYARVNRIKGIRWFESNKFFNFAVKTGFYALAIIASYGIDQIILEGETVLGVKSLVTKVLTMLFILNEMVSIDETYEKQYKESMLTTLRRWMKKANGIKKDLKEIVTLDEDKE
jgi:phage-related holin